MFHWSPETRRNGIKRFGLVPGKLSTDGLWRPPYVALSDSPSMAWALSGATDRGAEHPRWDLWTVWSDRLEGYEIMSFNDGTAFEYRVYHRVYKRDVWYVATRER